MNFIDGNWTRLGCAWVCGWLAFAAPVRAADNVLSPAEIKDGWVLLFDGASTAGWMTSAGQPAATPVAQAALQPHIRSSGRISC